MDGPEGRDGKGLTDGGREWSWLQAPMRRVMHSLVDSETAERGCCNRTGRGWVIKGWIVPEAGLNLRWTWNPPLLFTSSRTNVHNLSFPFNEAPTSKPGNDYSSRSEWLEIPVGSLQTSTEAGVEWEEAERGGSSSGGSIDVIMRGGDFLFKPLPYPSAALNSLHSHTHRISQKWVSSTRVLEFIT